MEEKSYDRKTRIVGIIAFVFVSSFIILGLLGIRGPTFIDNQKCYQLLGCNMGFFGYDALLHFLSGFMNASLIIYLMRKYPALNFFRREFWKNALTVVSMVALIALLWEIGEFGHDQYRMKVLNINLTNPDRLDQASNSDTMGDMTFSIIGGAITAGTLASFMKKEDEA